MPLFARNSQSVTIRLHVTGGKVTASVLHPRHHTTRVAKAIVAVTRTVTATATASSTKGSIQGAFVDAWIGHVMPQAVTWELQ